VEIVSCYEAGYDGFWLHRLLEAHGIRNYVIDPASLQVDRRARRARRTALMSNDCSDH
jgi:transposase